MHHGCICWSSVLQQCAERCDRQTWMGPLNVLCLHYNVKNTKKLGKRWVVLPCRNWLELTETKYFTWITINIRHKTMETTVERCTPLSSTRIFQMYSLQFYMRYSCCSFIGWCKPCRSKIKTCYTHTSLLVISQKIQYILYKYNSYFCIDFT
jgi:hypothetical protein